MMLLRDISTEPDGSHRFQFPAPEAGRPPQLHLRGAEPGLRAPVTSAASQRDILCTGIMPSWSLVCALADRRSIARSLSIECLTFMRAGATMAPTGGGRE